MRTQPSLQETRQEAQSTENRLGLVARDEKLSGRLAVDTACAVTGGLAAAPLVTIIDLAVIEVALSGKSLLKSMWAAFPCMVCRPHRLLLTRPFGFMFLLYGGTYFTANTMDTISSAAKGLDTKSTDSSLTKLGIVSAANMALSLAKDNQFAKAFGAASARPLPAVSYAPLILRDGITLYASFNLPPLIATSLPESWDNIANRLFLAQLTAPAASQLVASPLHLLGLDLYHRPGQIPFGDRMQRIRQSWIPSSLARMCRVIPGLSLGNVVNTDMRNKLMDKFFP